MIISGVSEKNGRKIAYVCFEEDSCMAEAVIPDCRIIKNDGFTGDELSQLENYLRKNLADIKKEAAKINPLTAMLK